MRCKPPDSRTYEALRSLNAGFLALVTDPDGLGVAPRLGLDPPICAQLSRLAPEELEFIAGTPSLLAGFDTPDRAHAVLSGRVAEPRSDSVAWSDARSAAARVFAAALLTYLWQMDRRDRLMTALCVGSAEPLPDLTIARIQAYAAEATHRLRARFADHPCFWPDLIRAARSHDPDLRYLSRLTVIPLSLAEGRAAR